MDVKEAVARVCELVRKHAGYGLTERAKERQGAALAWRTPDYLPLMMSGHEPAVAELPSYDWAQQYADPAKSFVMQMKSVAHAAEGGGDIVPGIRCDTGVVNAPSVFGVEFVVPEHTKPVVSKHCSKDDLQSFETPDNIAELGNLPTIREHTQHHLAALEENGLGELVNVYHCDTQGPFDIAHQARGSDIFIDIYEDPDFFHHLMKQATKVFILLSRFSKGMVDEGNWGNASGYWMLDGGIRMCEDSSILVSQACYNEHIRPYNEEALEEFGGGWIHYCGSVPGTGRPGGEHLHDVYAKTKNLRGLNFTTSGDLDAEIRKLVDNQVAFIGNYPRQDGESLDSYFRRVLELLPSRTGLLLCAPSIKKEEAMSAFDTWYKIQDQVLP